MRQAMTHLRSGLSLAFLALVATACDATIYRDSGTPAINHGNAVQQNMAVMIVDPQPATAANTEIDFDGRRAGLAIERYREGKVIPPHQMRTSDVLSGSE
jgi:type IV pilus biogenesis protein CpaD/CtpE